MEEMGEDEVMAMLASIALGLWGAYHWYTRALTISRLGALPFSRTLLLVAPLTGLTGLWWVLRLDAAIDVRNDVRYQWLFLAMGSIWVLVLPRALGFIGVSYRDDALERHNIPATIALAGTTASLAVLFAGSNMGEGPSIWNTVATAVAATGFLFAAVLLLAVTTSVGDTISVERDMSAGMRFAGWILASGIILSRACMGDWVSGSAMLEDLFGIGWPVVGMLVVAMTIEIRLRPRGTARPLPWIVAGVLPAAAYLAASVGYVATVANS